MHSDHCQRMEAEALARLLEFDSASQLSWSQADLAAMWRHQLAAPLATELMVLEPACLPQWEALSGAAEPPIRTMEDLLYHPNPPLQLLDMVKQFAKAHVADGQLLPRGIATLLYFASILVVRLRWGQRITSLEDKQLLTRLRQLLRQPWVDPRTRQLLEEGVVHLQSA